MNKRFNQAGFLFFCILFPTALMNERTFANECCFYSASSSDFRSCEPVRFEKAIERALLRSPKLQIAKAAVDAKAALVKQASSYPNPVFSFDTCGFCGNHGANGYSNRSDNYSISQLFEPGGKRCIRMNLAEYEYYSALQDFEIVKLRSLVEIYAIGIDLACKQYRLLLSEQQTCSARTCLLLVKEKEKQDAGDFLAKIKREVALANAEMAEEHAKRDFGTAKHEWEKISGCSFDSLTFPFREISAPMPAERYLQLLKDHPAVVKSRIRHAAAWEGVRLEKSTRIPDVAVSLGYGNDYSCGDYGMTFGISFPLPIFDRNEGNIARAHADVLKAEYEYQDLVRRLESRILRMHGELMNAYREAHRMQTQILPAATKAYELYAQQISQGKASEIDKTEAAGLLSAVKMQYIDLLKNCHNLKASLDYFDGSLE